VSGDGQRMGFLSPMVKHMQANWAQGGDHGHMRDVCNVTKTIHI